MNKENIPEGPLHRVQVSSGTRKPENAFVTVVSSTMIIWRFLQLNSRHNTGKSVQDGLVNARKLAWTVIVKTYHLEMEDVQVDSAGIL